MKRYAGDLLDGKGIAHTLNFPDVSTHIVMPMEQRRDFYLIFKEALNNLVKYARATEARVEIVASKTQVALSIADNGVGFDAERTPKGNGLENMQQRARRWKGRLMVESRPDQGTTITLSMPLAK
jgi:signal transduction histidine kinase